MGLAWNCWICWEKWGDLGKNLGKPPCKVITVQRKEKLTTLETGNLHLRWIYEEGLTYVATCIDSWTCKMPSKGMYMCFYFRFLFMRFVAYSLEKNTQLFHVFLHMYKTSYYSKICYMYIFWTKNFHVTFLKLYSFLFVRHVSDINWKMAGALEQYVNTVQNLSTQGIPYILIGSFHQINKQDNVLMSWMDLSNVECSQLATCNNLGNKLRIKKISTLNFLCRLHLTE